MRYELGQVSVAGTTVPGRAEPVSTVGPTKITNLAQLGLVKNQTVHVGVKRALRTVRGIKEGRVQMDEDFRLGVDYHPNDIAEMRKK